MPKPNGTLLLRHAQLEIHWPHGQVEVVALAKESTRIGRGKTGNDVAVFDTFQSVSRQHVEIRREKNGYRLMDLESGNGVLVNDLLVKDVVLTDGDEIKIGLADQNQEIRIIFKAGAEHLINQLKSNDAPTLSGLLSSPPTDVPYLKIRWQNGNLNYFAIKKDRIVIGRDKQADLVLPESARFVSGAHAEIEKTADGFVVRDLNSTNGTSLNNQRLNANETYPLQSESILRMGDDDYGISISFTFINPILSGTLVAGFIQSAEATRLTQSETVLIGRMRSCDLVLDSPEVSREHAKIRRIGDAYILEDLGSRNGTFVNDTFIKQVELHEGDVIQISKFHLLFENGLLVPYQSSGMRLDANNLSRDVNTKNGKRRILDRVNLSVLPREFIALVGGSGAGKSTLLNRLIGALHGEGEVKLNGYDFYKEYESFRAQLGYVPQSDILHTSLTVEKALDYATRLRLPANLTREERMQRIDMVLNTVSMNTDAIRKTRIANLSGGQRKRVSIAAELLADPKLIYLDEATSGLDPGLEKKMMHTLRRMADEGRTVILITHATDNIVQTDHVAFLSEGKLVYFGPSEEALTFFEVDEFADIYERIDHKGEAWRKTFEEEKPEHYQKYILDRKTSLQKTPKRALPKVHFGLADFIRQWIVLMQRSLSVLFSDPITLGLMLLLFPVTATLQLVIAKPDILTGNLSILADPVLAAKSLLESYIPFPHTNTFVFVMGLEAVLTGLFVPSNDLVKERSIYLRERMVNLRVLPYLFNKVAIYSVFIVVQVILYLIIISFGVNIPEQGLYFNGYVELFITLYLTMMAGITFGLIISAASKSTEMAIYMLTMLLFFQFFFAGAVFDLRGNTFEPLSYFSTTRWSLTALGVTIDMNKIAESTILCNDVPENPLDPNSALKTVCFNYPEAKDDLRLNYADDQLILSWLVLAGMSVAFLAVTWFLIRRVDAA